MVSIIICKFRLEIYLLCCGPPKIFHGPQKFDFYPWLPFNVAWPPGWPLGPRLGTPDLNGLFLGKMNWTGRSWILRVDQVFLIFETHLEIEVRTAQCFCNRKARRVDAIDSVFRYGSTRYISFHQKPFPCSDFDETLHTSSPYHSPGSFFSDFEFSKYISKLWAPSQMKVHIYNLFQYSKKEVISHIKKPSAWKKVAPHHSFVTQK